MSFEPSSSANGETLPSPDSHINSASALIYWNSTDATQSANFLAKLRRESRSHPPGKKLSRVVDCGAGIGRITLGFLSKVAEVVDVVEPVKKFTEEIGKGEEWSEVVGREGIGQIWNVGLEGWPPANVLGDGSREYDIIWIQWCLGQCTDAQVHELFGRIKERKLLSEGGWIVVKENLSNHFMGEDVYDETDSSVTRTDDKFRTMFKKAGCKIVATELQRGFPKGLYQVRMYALQPMG
ncbi:hypothetical protein H2203_003514 [Taxawa tesnikishii (nom. ined.)]|nr:hypothetical protein H2203_003514 [Dothideales sp. JES 119]